MGMRDTLNNFEKANWRKEENWGAVRVADGSQGLRFSLEKLSEKEREELKNELERLDIHFHERTATQSGPAVSAGDLTVRILDPDSLNKLKSSIFEKPEDSGAFWDNWAEKDNLAKEESWVRKFWKDYDESSKKRMAEGGIFISPWDAFVNTVNSETSEADAKEMFSEAHARVKAMNFKDPKGKSLKTDEWANSAGTPLLTLVIQRKKDSIAKTLINEFYSNVRTANKDGLTPLHAAAMTGSMEMCKLLMREGADPLAKIKETKMMPHEMAKEKGHKDVADYLLKEAQNKRLFQIGLNTDYMNR